MKIKLAWAIIALIPLIFLACVVWSSGWLGMLTVSAGITFCLGLAVVFAWSGIQILESLESNKE